MILKYIVKENDNFQNLKELLKAYLQISDRLLIKLKKMQGILVNGFPVYIHYKLSVGDEVIVSLDYEEDNSNIVPTKMNLEILYENEAMLIINKPPHMPVHPSMQHYENSLSNGVRFYFDSIGLKKKIRPVNRLDKDTSGIVIFAKNEYIQECLVTEMKNKTFRKEYIAVCYGKFEQTSGTINLPIARKEGSIIERCVNQNGETAITHYTVLKYIDIKKSHQIYTNEHRALNNNLLNSETINSKSSNTKPTNNKFSNTEPTNNKSSNTKPMSGIIINSITTNNLSIEGISVVQFILETGRTHQIRVHTSAIGHPIVGDTLYGPSSIDNTNRQLLHAYKIHIIHPVTKEHLDIIAKIPDDIDKYIQ